MAERDRDPRIPTVAEAQRRMDATAAAQLARRSMRKTRRGLLTPQARAAFDLLQAQLKEFFGRDLS